MTLSPSRGTFDLFGIPLGAWKTTELIDVLCRSARERRPLLATYLNAHNVNISRRNRRYAEVLSRADIVYADGMSIVWASRWLSPPGLPERVNAGDFLGAFCQECVNLNLRIYLLGSEPGAAERCGAWMRSRAPGLNVVGTGDGFWGRGGKRPDEQCVIRDIQEARPDILLVGLGVPRQELWAVSRATELGVPVIWCVGALFEYFSGRRRRAPVWMRRAGLEWVFRLALEPRRLAVRYLWGNFEFLIRVISHPRRRRK